MTYLPASTAHVNGQDRFESPNNVIVLSSYQHPCLYYSFYQKLINEFQCRATCQLPTMIFNSHHHNSEREMSRCTNRAFKPVKENETVWSDDLALPVLLTPKHIHLSPRSVNHPRPGGCAGGGSAIPKASGRFLLEPRSRPFDPIEDDEEAYRIMTPQWYSSQEPSPPPVIQRRPMDFICVTQQDVSDTSILLPEL